MANKLENIIRVLIKTPFFPFLLFDCKIKRAIENINTRKSMWAALSVHALCFACKCFAIKPKLTESLIKNQVNIRPVCNHFKINAC